MSRKSFNINYKESQIIKHALERSVEHKKMISKLVKNDEFYGKDIQEEEKLLQRVEGFVDEYKKYIGLDKVTKF